MRLKPLASYDQINQFPLKRAPEMLYVAQLITKCGKSLIVFGSANIPPNYPWNYIPRPYELSTATGIARRLQVS